MLLIADDRLRVHLAIAVRAHLRSLRRDGVQPPEDLLRLADELSHVLSSAPECSALPDPDQGADSDDAVFGSIPEVARRMAVSSSTVRRLVASGNLPSVRVRTAIRIPLAAVDEYGKEARDE